MLFIHRIMVVLIYRIMEVPKTLNEFNSRSSKQSYGEIIENNFLRKGFHILYPPVKYIL